MNPLSLISGTMGAPVVAYVAAAALAAGLAGGWGACHYVTVVPMELAQSKAAEERVHAALAGTMKTLTTERETQDAMQVLVKDWQHGDPAARARTAGLADRLRHPTAIASDSGVPEVHGASGGPATCDDRLRQAGGTIDDIDRATEAVAESAAVTVETLAAARDTQRTLTLAQAALKACEAMTRK